jgi:hypothetical protein
VRWPDVVDRDSGMARVSAREERAGDEIRRHKPKRKRNFCEGANGTRARRAGWVRPQEEFKWKLIFEFQLNLNFGKTLGNSIRRFRRNLDMRIFPKFFWVPQGFLENKICLAVNAF